MYAHPRNVLALGNELSLDLGAVMRNRWQLRENAAMVVVMKLSSRLGRRDVSQELHTWTSKSGLIDLARYDKAR
jgi:hypothetical protein